MYWMLFLNESGWVSTLSTSSESCAFVGVSTRFSISALLSSIWLPWSHFFISPSSTYELSKVLILKGICFDPFALLLLVVDTTSLLILKRPSSFILKSMCFYPFARLLLVTDKTPPLLNRKKPSSGKDSYSKLEILLLTSSWLYRLSLLSFSPLAFMLNLVNGTEYVWSLVNSNSACFFDSRAPEYASLGFLSCVLPGISSEISLILGSSRVSNLCSVSLIWTVLGFAASFC